MVHISQHRVVALLFALLVLLAASLPARADIEADLAVGHDGRWIQDAATPVFVNLRSRDDKPVLVTITIGFDSGSASDVSCTRTIQIPPGAERREVFFLPGPSEYGSALKADVETSPRVPVLGEGRRGDRGRLSLNGGSKIGAGGLVVEGGHAIGVTGDPRAFPVLAARLPDAEKHTQLLNQVEPRERIEVIHVDPAVLVHAPIALDGMESLVVVNPDSEFAATPRETDALLDWVALGGRLVVSLGDRASQFAAAPLAAEMPATWGRTTGANYVAVAEALGVEWKSKDQPSGAPGVVAMLEPRADAGAQVLVPGLALQRPYGRGLIVLLGYDVRSLLLLPHPAGLVAKKTGIDVLWQQDVSAPRDLEKSPTGLDPGFAITEPMNKILAGEAFAPPNAALVFFGLVLYVLVVGPIDWFVLKRMKKERWTTFTFVTAVTLFTLIAYIVSFFLFGADRQTNRIVFIDLVDGQRGGRELARVRDLAGHYAPTGGTLDLRPTTPTAFLGGRFPGSHQMAGVGSRLTMTLQGTDPTQPRADVPIAFRSQRIVSSLSVGTTGRTLDVAVEGKGEQARYTLTNGLPADVTSAFLLLPGNRIASFGVVKAGASAAGTITGVNALVTRTELATSSPTDRRAFLARIVAARFFQKWDPPDVFHALGRAGVVARAPDFARGPDRARAILLAFADECPFPLPDTESGTHYVVLTREVPLP